jgi:hypothetical protein
MVTFYPAIYVRRDPSLSLFPVRGSEDKSVRRSASNSSIFPQSKLFPSTTIDFQISIFVREFMQGSEGSSGTWLNLRQRPRSSFILQYHHAALKARSTHHQSRTRVDQIQNHPRRSRSAINRLYLAKNVWKGRLRLVKDMVS